MAKKDINVLFVCLGNICRSPLAEAIFKQKVIRLGLDEKIHIDSCGTGDYHIGELPDERTIEIATRNEVPIEHRARQFDKDDFINFDHILAMDHSNVENIYLLDPDRKFQHVELMRKYDSAGDSMEVPDPYWGGLDGFQEVFNILDRSTNEFLEQLRGRYNL